MLANTSPGPLAADGQPGFVIPSLSLPSEASPKVITPLQNLKFRGRYCGLWSVRAERSSRNVSSYEPQCLSWKTEAVHIRRRLKDANSGLKICLTRWGRPGAHRLAPTRIRHVAGIPTGRPARSQGCNVGGHPGNRLPLKAAYSGKTLCRSPCW